MKRFFRLFLGSSAISGASAGIGLLATVLLVRWFGPVAYANYMVDLAILSLMMIFLEIVPSNYSVFRIQDDAAWLRSVGVQIAASMAVAPVIVAAVGGSNLLFLDYTGWMALYAASLALKRYLDLRLQSSGRLQEFLRIELLAVVIRLGLLAIFMRIKVHAVVAVWASLAIGSVMSQALWWLRNPGEVRAFGLRDKAAWSALIRSSPDYAPYYVGIVLKRLKDNIVPLAADVMLSSREILATFLLAYRGVVFAVGQLRIIESLLNHRGTLSLAIGLTRRQTVILVMAAQALCLVASVALIVSSGVPRLPWMPTVALSFTVWPIAYLTLERAKAYSKFKASGVNASIAAYLAALILALGASSLFEAQSITTFALIIVGTEVVGLFVLKTCKGSGDAKAA